ncbi:MAG TPA: PIN domain-containing protein [Isosphaeraceae bacterium]|nr:PIN domain-containing protein [Isosphaeraceae bacterium]
MTERRVLVDTGPLVAIFSEDDSQHQRCSAALKTLRPPLFTCWPVIAEAAWLLRQRPQSFYQLFDGFESGVFSLLPLDADDLPAIAAIMRRYEDAGLQLADAALAYLAERENIRTVFTLDRRDFSIIRLKHNRALTLLPDVHE